MHFIQSAAKAQGKTGAAFPLPFAEGTIAVLGLLSFLFNAFFCFIVLIMIRTKKLKEIPLWIVIINFILLLAQVYWFIIDTSK